MEALPQPAITSGILSRLQEWEHQGITFFQTDATIVGGQSGGVLADSQGRVIGVTGLIFGRDFGLAASAQDLSPVIGRLIEGEDVSGLGVQAIPSSGGRHQLNVEIPSFFDVRSFVIQAPVNTEIDLRVEGPGDATFWVADNLGNALLDRNETPRGLESGTFTIAMPGPHFLQVSIASDHPGGFALTSNVPLYPLVDPDGGRPITVGETLIAYMDSPQDYDSFTIELSEGETVVVDAHSLYLDLALIARFPGSTEEQRVVDDNNGGGLFGVDPSLVYRAPTAGTHSISVAEPNGSAGGAYPISVREAPADAIPAEIPATRDTLDTQFGTMWVYRRLELGFSVQIPVNWDRHDVPQVTYYAVGPEGAWHRGRLSCRSRRIIPDRVRRHHPNPRD